MISDVVAMNNTNASNNSILDDKKIFPKLPHGPLTVYRERATFDYRKLSLLFDGEEAIRFKHDIWDFYESHPEFSRSNKKYTLSELRHQATKRKYISHHHEKFDLQRQMANIELLPTLIGAPMLYEPCFNIKRGLAFSMCSFVLKSLGTERLEKYAEQLEKTEISAGFALTEIAHGTNALGMRTTATYDPKTEEFIIHTPDFEAAKCWIGNLGKTCTHCIVYAQLYTADGVHHGLNMFWVPIRNTKTLISHAGVIVGDLGEKIGLNGLDNGFVIFDQYRIPRENLLARLGDVTPEGKFVSHIKDNKKRMGSSFGSLSSGRVNICIISNSYMIKAISIAVRYSASRKQFGPENSKEELPVLEYQAQQYRLLPHLAATIAQKVFSSWFAKENMYIIFKQMAGDVVAGLGLEVHALSSVAKPICSWSAQRAIQDCREACGGHGYLKVSGIGDLRNDNDPNCTYEGENNVLMQQTSNWLLSIRRTGYESFRESSKLGTADFLADFPTVIKRKFTFATREEALNPDNILYAFEWLCAYLLEETYNRSEGFKKVGKSAFDTRNNIQVFYASTLALVYAERAICNVFYKFINNLDNSPERTVLTRVLTLYGGNLLIQHLGLLYEGGFIEGPIPAKLYKLGIIDIMESLKDDAISLVDAIAPTDFIINSPLGMSDGEIYKHLQSSLMQSPETFERPNWWQDVVHWKSYVQSKL